MADKIALFYFSGTGNTRLVCEKLAGELTGPDCECVLIPIEDQLREDHLPDINDYTMVGIAHPVHAWDAPRIVHDFAKRLPSAHHTRTFMLKTAGGYSAGNNGASHGLIRRLEARGYDVFYDRTICMPSNWLVKTADATAKRLYITALDKVKHMAAELTGGTKRSLPMGTVIKMLFSAAAFMEDKGARFIGKDLRADANCTNCGWCIRTCPVDNITEKNGRIRFGWKCMMCMRCVYGCPRGAINYRIFKPLRITGGYNLKKLIADTTLTPAVLDGRTRGYDKAFVPYVSDISR